MSNIDIPVGNSYSLNLTSLENNDNSLLKNLS